MSRSIVLLFLGAIAGVSGIASAITIDTVRVGNPGNADDTSDGDDLLSGTQRFGSVDYIYRIATTEVTVGQYTDFLNAVASIDIYGLYSGNIRGIRRTGSLGSYTYTTTGSPNKPVTNVSWGDAARFANWLHNGQPTGSQDPETTESGAYALNGAVSDAALYAVTRNADALWFIPSEDEWYKAAYHKNDGVTGNYWDYPTSSNSAPYSDQPPGSDAPTQSNTANYSRNDSVANGYDDGFAATGSTFFATGGSYLNYLTDVGAYTSSTSPYGTFDQAGNVREWTEGIFGQGIYGGRVHRGGSWQVDSNQIIVSDRDSFTPTTQYPGVGFRMATFVPEPSSIALAAVALVGLVALGRRTGA